MANSHTFLDELESYIDHANAHAPLVSAWTVGMHIEHCCKAMIVISRILADSKPPVPKSKRSLRTGFVFLFGKIPRGRGKSPDAVKPSDNMSPQQLGHLMNESRAKFIEASRLAPDAWFKHFVFGTLTRDKSIRFIQIHTKHHLKIMADITRGV